MTAVDVVVGRVGRPHGVRGELSIELRTDEPTRRFAPGAMLHLVRSAAARPGLDRWPVERTVTVVSTRWHQGRMLVRLDGVDDRDAAEALRGLLLVVRVEEDEEPEEPGEYYDRQLVGLAVLDAAGQRAGTVRAVVHLPAHDLLEVDVEDGRRLVPFVEALVPEVDLAAGHLRLADVEGLLDDLEG
ncbi:ribosome maturation factor RimM [Desertihabitans brevis]|uniref:Ribosome maturation factor RimM n=1 Tax=Desertihabitans brevis TaxID=2268447 RepID=A0A367YQR5_9ACTN|nr:ribosome maturation factor RimM [Desertihabitans brevis]RCK68168.1 ribosome maturation factor RimM [Desertihabitans brevis]